MAQRKRELTPFGAYLTETIEKAKILKCDFYTAVDIGKPYFYEILIDAAPPQEVLEKMLAFFDEVLGPDDNRRNKFYDLAAASRGELPADIMNFLIANPQTWESLRKQLPSLPKKR